LRFSGREENMAQFKEFTEKVVLVTGAGKGIGKAIAIGFANEGANIVANDVDYDAAKSVSREIEGMGRKCLVVKSDVSNAREVLKMFDEAVKHFGTVHILINNAGIGGAGAFLEDTPEEEFDRTMDVNFKAAFLCTRAAIPLMKKNGYGKIVNIASTAGKRIASGAGGDYAASKAAMLSLTRTFAYELAPYGINVNATCPGRTVTPLVEQGDAKEHVQRLKSIPMGRYATPEDQANAVILLCSDRASYIVGQHLEVDGGILLSWTDFDNYKRIHGR
jgi:NAD(P)-dependent dehydrogenase (short-subunit alcohol dehydrogenase family)